MKITKLNSHLEVPLYRLDNRQPILDINGTQVTTVFRNCLLSAFYSDWNLDWTPDEQFCIYDASMFKTKKGWDVESIYKLLKEYGNYDFSGSSRKFGRFFASKKGGLIEQYFNPKNAFSKVTSHGSIFTSHCYNGMWQLDNVKILVVNDDDPYFQELYGVADGYGLISEKAAKQLGDVWNGQTQFRIGQKCTPDQMGWIGKGTLQVKPNLCSWNKERSYWDEEVDIILCRSHLKGMDLIEEYVYQMDNVILGAMASSNKIKKSKVPTAVLNYFKSEPVQQWLCQQVEAECHNLNELRSNLKALAYWVLENSDIFYDEDCDSFLTAENYNQLNQFFELVKEKQLSTTTINQTIQDKKLELSKLNNLDNEMTIAYIIVSSQYPEQVFDHPKICKWASSVLAKGYRNAALTANLKAHYLMAAPAWDLPERVVATDALPSGRYLLWRLPIESRASIDYVQVVSARHFFKQDDKDIKYNNVFINPKYFEQFGGDYDGDCVNLFPLADMPFMVDEILTWGELPYAEKPPKGNLQGNKYSIAAKSVDVNVGTPFNLMMQYVSLDLMTDKLSILFAKEIKIATDSYKTDAEPNKKWLAARIKQVKGYLGDNLHWLTFSQHKHQDTYLSKPIKTGCDDTISLMINTANSLWHPIVWSQAKASHHFRFLFSDIHLSDEKKAEYKVYVKHYASLVSGWLKQTKNMSEEYRAKAWLSMVYEPFYVQVMKPFDEACKQHGLNEDAIAQEKYILCALMHNAFHYKPVSGEGLYRLNTHLWKMFPEQYIQCLNQMHWKKICLWRHSDKAPTDYPDTVWNSEIKSFVIHYDADQLWMIDNETGKCLGKVSENPNADTCIPPVGLQGKAQLKSVLNRSGQVSRVEAILV